MRKNNDVIKLYAPFLDYLESSQMNNNALNNRQCMWTSEITNYFEKNKFSFAGYGLRPTVMCSEVKKC